MTPFWRLVIKRDRSDITYHSTPEGAKARAEKDAGAPVTWRVTSQAYRSTDGRYLITKLKMYVQ